MILTIDDLNKTLLFNDLNYPIKKIRAYIATLKKKKYQIVLDNEASTIKVIHTTGSAEFYGVKVVPISVPKNKKIKPKLTLDQMIENWNRIARAHNEQRALSKKVEEIKQREEATV